MPVGFVAYIDESGDEGFTFKDFPERASSEWFVLSAYILPVDYEMQELRAINKVIGPIESARQSDIHFHKLNHEQRVAVAHAIGNSNGKIITVNFDKRKITSAALKEKHKLYFYGVRLLTERISWLTYYSKINPDRDLTTKLVFSNRSKMSYDDLKQYLRVLKANGLYQQDVRIKWEAIDIPEIKARQHNQLIGLKCADAIATSIARALELSPYGFTEPQYIRQLRNIFYTREIVVQGNGLKFFPKLPQTDLNNAERYVWIEKFFPR